MSTTAAAPELSARDRSILEFQLLRWHPAYLGLRDTAIHELFGMTWVRYTQVLHSILDDPAAEKYNPQLVHRLRRLREARMADRVSRARGFSIEG